MHYEDFGTNSVCSYACCPCWPAVRPLPRLRPRRQPPTTPRWRRTLSPSTQWSANPRLPLTPPARRPTKPRSFRSTCMPDRPHEDRRPRPGEQSVLDSGQGRRAEGGRGTGAYNVTVDWIVPGETHTADDFSGGIEAAIAQEYDAIATIAGDAGLVTYIDRPSMPAFRLPPSTRRLQRRERTPLLRRRRPVPAG